MSSLVNYSIIFLDICVGILTVSYVVDRIMDSRRVWEWRRQNLREAIERVREKNPSHSVDHAYGYDLALDNLLRELGLEEHE